MKISFNQPYYAPQFKSSSSFYKMQDGKEMGTWTWFFRKDLRWEEFIRYQEELFKDKDKVNIVQFGASDGTEAFTYIMSLFEYADEKYLEKCNPITAYDIKDSMVKMASSGYVHISPQDESCINSKGIGIKRYFRTPDTEPSYSGFSTLYSVRSKLKNRVNFNQGDMFEILPTLKDDSNTILLCRNCLGYFADYPSKVQRFIETASNILKENSLFVIGLLEEEEPSIQALLRKHNFGRVMHNVYQKL